MQSTCFDRAPVESAWLRQLTIREVASQRLRRSRGVNRLRAYLSFTAKSVQFAALVRCRYGPVNSAYRWLKKSVIVAQSGRPERSSDPASRGV